MRYNIPGGGDMKLIERKSYLNQLINVMNTPDIKVITGVRRCGKSKLMDAFISYVQKQSANSNVIRIKLNLKGFESLKIGDNLYKYVDTRYTTKEQNFLFVDEVQLCDGFETVINSLYEEERFNIFLTGSNAFLLLIYLATLFGGRVFEISLYPFSFSEYLLYYPQTDIDDAFDKYVITGGMAGSYLYNDSADSRKYLSNIVRTTIMKDIVTKFKIENEDLLNMIVDFLMDNIGSKTSIRNIANALTSNTYKTNDKTCGAYIDYICRSFLFYPFKRYDVKGKRYLESDKKYYLADLSFRFAVIGTKNADYGHLYENLVAIELLRRGYEVYVGQLGEKEVDFVAVKDGYKTYIQVCDDVSREETLKREISPLLAIKDAYPKIIIARTKHPESQVEGIRIIDIARWLVSQI